MRRQRLPPVSAAIDHPEPRAGPSDHEDLAREFERAVHQLRSQSRLVFQPYHEQSLSCEEIAHSIDRPIGTVKTWLFRARAELAECLSRRGLEGAAAAYPDEQDAQGWWGRAWHSSPEKPIVMRCHEFDEIWSGLLDGETPGNYARLVGLEVPPGELVELEGAALRHARQCPRCCQTQASYLRLREALRAWSLGDRRMSEQFRRGDGAIPGPESRRYRQQSIWQGSCRRVPERSLVLSCLDLAAVQNLMETQHQQIASMVSAAQQRPKNDVAGDLDQARDLCRLFDAAYLTNRIDFDSATVFHTLGLLSRDSGKGPGAASSRP